MRSAFVRLSGHPDHACDLVAEAVVDEYLRRDPASRVRLAVSGGRGVLFIAGDVFSQADFDVSAIVKRTLGALGVADQVEVFVSLEAVPSERVTAFRLSQEEPVTVTGYATSETEEMLPLPISLARRLAKRLHDKRLNDAEWFWLGPDAEVSVMGDGGKPLRIVVTLEHGGEALTAVRKRIAEELGPLASGATVEVNPAGARERRGLALASGSSHRASSVYGSLIPTRAIAGCDPASAEKAGAWLARAAARNIVASGAKAALVQAVYLPGERLPFIVTARDEAGRDKSSLVPRETLALDRVMKAWWRPGLNLDAARWGFAGEAGMPWEA